MRLTAKKVSAWHAKVERARRTLNNVQMDIRSDRLKAKGGDLYELTNTMRLMGDALANVIVTEDSLAKMAKRAEAKAARQ